MRGTLFTKMYAGRDLLIYLPPSYDKALYPLPVVYVHDGGDVFDLVLNGTLYNLEQRFAAGTLPELILVGIAAYDPLVEYTPWYARALYPGLGHGDFGGRATEYLNLIAHEIKPWIDQNFYTDNRPEMTGIVGKSLGGLVSLFAAYVYPHVFGRIGVMSASLWYEGFIEFMRERQHLSPDLRIYMDIGNLEGLGKANRQRLIQTCTDEAVSILMNNLAESHFYFERIEGDDHDPETFYQRFPDLMGWLFDKKTVGLFK